MKDLLLYILKSIVDQPDSVNVEETTDETGLITLTATVANEDMGRVIGKSGKVINSIRQVVKIPAIKQGKRVNIVLKEPEGSAPTPEPTDTPQVSEKTETPPQAEDKPKKTTEAKEEKSQTAQK